MTIDLFGKMVNIDPHYGNNFIDANVLDRKGTAEDEAVDKILELAEDGKFTLLLAYSVKAEIEHPNTPLDVKRRDVVVRTRRKLFAFPWPTLLFLFTRSACLL
jgi:hypothetical protein